MRILLIVALVTGFATWYDWRPGEAAAGPSLRRALGAHWRGQTVRVCGLSNCTTVRLTDWCACGGDRVIDLDEGSFKQLAPLSRGVIKVTVSTTDGPVKSGQNRSDPVPTGPPTDVEEK